MGLAFSLMMIYMAIVHYKKGSLNGMEIATWSVIWILTIFVVIFPDVVRTYSETFAVSRVLDLLIAGAFVLVISMVASAYIRVNYIEKKLNDLVRKLSLKDSDSKSKK